MADLDPLAAAPCPGSPIFVLIPGSKATIAALAALRANGWDMSLALGVCGKAAMS